MILKPMNKQNSISWGYKASGCRLSQVHAEQVWGARIIVGITGTGLAGIPTEINRKVVINNG